MDPENAKVRTAVHSCVAWRKFEGIMRGIAVKDDDFIDIAGTDQSAWVAHQV